MENEKPPLENAARVQEPDLDDEVPGFLSVEDKRKFTMTAGITGALFFIGQFVLPMIIMMPMMFAGMFFNMSNLRMAEPQRGALFEGAVWYPEKGMGMRRGGPGVDPEDLRSFRIDPEAVPQTAGPLGLDGAWLLAGLDRLWVITSSEVGIFRDGKLKILTDSEILGDICRPFWFEGVPAVVRLTPDGTFLMAFRNGGWEEVMPLALSDEPASLDLGRNLQVVNADGILHLFLRFGESVYTRTVDPAFPEQEPEEWASVDAVGRYWTVALIDKRPAVFGIPRGDGDFRQKLMGFREENGVWKEFFSHAVPAPSGLGVFPLPEEGAFALLVQGFPGSVRMLKVENGEVAWQRRYGRGFPFSTPMIAAMFLPYFFMAFFPIVLALIFTGLMKKHRVAEFEAGSRSVPFATLNRRGLAQIIDAVVMGAPSVAGFGILMTSFMDMEEMFFANPLYMVLAFALSFAGFLWAILVLVLFSVMEGSRGYTPGKWIAGIRVAGTDLRPIGFGRSIIRNILKMVDGFFSFMVGILMVALTENWQRVGDLAARSIVVEAQGLEESRVPSYESRVPGAGSAGSSHKGVAMKVQGNLDSEGEAPG